MKEFNYVPVFRQGFNEITDGIEIKAPDYCIRNCGKNETCQNHYKEILGKGDGTYICPYGFNSTVFSDKDRERYIFTGMRVEGKYNAKLADPKTRACNAQGGRTVRKVPRKITEAELNDYIQYYLEYKCGVESYEKLKIFVEDVFHDIRKFNAQLKTKGDRLYSISSGIRKNGHLLETTQNIQAICAFMSLRLNAYDFTYNEQLLTATEKSSYNIYRIFDKVKHCMKNRADEKQISILIECNGQCGDIKAYDCIELLPYILLDNGIKYSDKKSKIIVTITDNVKTCSFQVKSQSLPLKPGEEEKIFLRGYRGENARNTITEGLGIGLYTAKRICEVHNAKIAVEPGFDIVKNVNNFIIDVTIEKEYNI